jgi:hypothetical protein
MSRTFTCKIRACCTTVVLTGLRKLCAVASRPNSLGGFPLSLSHSGFLKSHKKLERGTEIASVRSVWKTDMLAVKHQPRVRGRTSSHRKSGNLFVGDAPNW